MTVAVIERDGCLQRTVTVRSESERKIFEDRLNNRDCFELIFKGLYQQGKFSLLVHNKNGIKHELLFRDVRDLDGLKELVRALLKPLSKEYFGAQPPSNSVLRASTVANSPTLGQAQKRKTSLKTTPPKLRGDVPLTATAAPKPAAASGRNGKTANSGSSSDLSNLQKSAIRLIELGRNVFLTGGAGTGKSHLLPHILSSLNLMYPQGTVHVTSTTGISAVSIGGVTVHSWSGIGGDALSKDDLVKLFSQHSKKSVKARWYNTKVLIIDEISMLSAEFLTCLDIAARHCRNCSRPFGGIQVVALGDFFQLAPVSKNGAGRGEEARFAFQSPTWNLLFNKSNTVNLQASFRQSASPEFFAMLSNLRLGIVDSAGHALLRSCVGRVFPDDGIEPTVLHSRNVNVDTINAVRLAKLEEAGEEVRVFEAVDTGIQGLMKSCTAGATIKFCIGAQVMLTKNLNSTLANGSRGVIVEWAGANPRVKFSVNGTETLFNVGPVKFQICMSGKEVASRTQLPLALAYATTIHKSQGLTLSRVVCDLGKCFANGQVYVALSRVRRLEDLCLEREVGGLKKLADARVVEFFDYSTSSDGDGEDQVQNNKENN
jgi:ATP-dependent DNA helicase PIF1